MVSQLVGHGDGGDPGKAGKSNVVQIHDKDGYMMSLSMIIWCTSFQITFHQVYVHVYIYNNNIIYKKQSQLMINFEYIFIHQSVNLIERITWLKIFQA